MPKTIVDFHTPLVPPKNIPYKVTITDPSKSPVYSSLTVRELLKQCSDLGIGTKADRQKLTEALTKIDEQYHKQRLAQKPGDFRILLSPKEMIAQLGIDLSNEASKKAAFEFILKKAGVALIQP